MRLLLAGFGNVGRRLAELLAADPPHPGLASLEAAVVGITTGTRGALADPEGIDLRGALDHLERYGGFLGHPRYTGADTLTAAAGLDYDVLVELSPLTVADRGAPAIAHCRAALDRGRHVVTANKGPVAWAYRELAALAREHGRAFLHEATVMDGVPVFGLVRRNLRGNRIVAVEGILNSTTNVVLEAMAKGVGLADAVTEARRLGIAEADPSADLEGWDAAVKLSALATVLMDAELPPEAVHRDGVDQDTAARAAAAAERGRRLKLVAGAHRSGDAVHGAVRLRELAADDPFSLVAGTGSIVRIVTDIMGTVCVTEEHPDLSTTAYGVIADLFEIADRTAG